MTVGTMGIKISRMWINKIISKVIIMLHVGIDTNIDNLCFLHYMESQEKKKNGGRRYVNSRDEIIHLVAKDMNLQARTFGYIFNDDDYNEKLESILSRYNLTIDDLTHNETNKIIKAVHDGLDGRIYY